MPTPNFLNEDQVRALLTYEALIPAIRRAVAEFSAGRVIQPVRTVLSVAEYSGWFATMPAVYGEYMGAKLVSFYPGNAAHEIHTHHAMIQLFNSATGEPLGVLDGRLITEMRTAAVSAVAVDLLARPDTRVLAILGSGIQARSHFAALSCVRSFDEIRVWSRSPENAQRFAAEIGVASMATVEQAVADADVILTLTSASDPILFGRWIKATALVCAVGACTPTKRELDDYAMRGPVVVDSREACSRESGDILLAGATISGEIGELLNGASLPSSDHPTIFKSVGIATADIAAAALVYERFTGSDFVGERKHIPTG
jgi:ornithine cyclodeaminase/alanine dehydrogenase-like protein (mu-crystallin family)